MVKLNRPVGMLENIAKEIKCEIDLLEERWRNIARDSEELTDRECVRVDIICDQIESFRKELTAIELAIYLVREYVD